MLFNNVFILIDEVQVRLESAECRIYYLEYRLGFLEASYQQVVQPLIGQQQYQHSQYSIPVPHGELHMQGPTGSQHASYSMTSYSDYNQQSQLIYSQAPPPLANIIRGAPIIGSVIGNADYRLI